MDKKEFMKKVYSSPWARMREKYGFSQYERSLADFILKQIQDSNNCRMLDVAIGTGEPLAEFFSSKGYEVHGIDIASNLIRQCQLRNPNIKCKVGDVEHMDYPDNYFDLVLIRK